MSQFTFSPDKVEVWAKQKLANSPNDGQAFGYLYVAYKITNREKEADEVFKQIEALEKVARYDAFVSISGLESGLGSQEDAEKMIKRAVGIDKKRVEAWGMLGAIYMAMGRKKEAVKALVEATKLGCKLPHVWLWLGTLYNEQEDYNDAVHALNRADELKPQDFDTLHNLSIAYSALHQFTIARSLYERMLKLKPNDELTMLLIAQHEFSEGRRDSAISWYRSVIEHHPKSNSGWRGLATVFELMGKKSEAKEVKLKAAEHGIKVFIASDM